MTLLPVSLQKPKPSEKNFHQFLPGQLPRRCLNPAGESAVLLLDIIAVSTTDHLLLFLQKCSPGLLKHHTVLGSPSLLALSHGCFFFFLPDASVHNFSRVALGLSLYTPPQLFSPALVHLQPSLSQSLSTLFSQLLDSWSPLTLPLVPTSSPLGTLLALPSKCIPSLTPHHFHGCHLVGTPILFPRPLHTGHL